MSYELPAKNSVVMWQTIEEGIAEPAILIEFYSDCIQIIQDGQRIDFNYDSLKDLIKILKNAHNYKD